MEAATLEALEGSIAKWQAIVDGSGADRLADNCALCKEFLDCDGCPVAESTGMTGCLGSPWDKWYRAQSLLKRNYRGGEWVADTEALMKLAQAELDFLKSLRPSAVSEEVHE